MAKTNARLANSNDKNDLETFIGYNLKRAYIIIKDDFNKSLGPNGLAPREFSLLSLVVTFPHITQSELARMLGIERSGLVSIVDKLEGANYLQRVVMPSDRRAQALVASDVGKQAYADMLVIVTEHEERLLTDLSADERTELIRLLQKIRRKDKNQ